MHRRYRGAPRRDHEDAIPPRAEVLGSSQESAEVGYCGAWRKLTAALEGLPIATPTAGGLSQARRALR